MPCTRSGRATAALRRALIGQLAADAGFHVAWERLTAARNIETSVAAMRGDNAPLREAIGELLCAQPPAGGRDRRAASFPVPAAYATPEKPTPAQARSTARPKRGPGVER